MKSRSHKTDRRAAGYERDGLAKLLVTVQRAALAELSVTATDRFLDVGCATGAAVRAAAENASVSVGVDISRPMIVHARQNSGGLPCRFLVADASRLPFATESFTAVLCTSVLTYVDKPADVIAELWRVTKPEGRFVLGYFDVLGHLNTGPRTRCLSLLTALGNYRVVIADKHD